MVPKAYISWLSSRKGYSGHTLSAYISDCSQFLEYLEASYDGLPPEETDRYVIRSFLAHLIEKGAGRATVARKLASLRTYFDYLRKSGMISVNHARKINAPAVREVLPHFISEDEAENLLVESSIKEGSFAEVRDRLVLEVLYGTGMRVSELCGMKVEDVFINDQTVKVTGKRNKERYIPLPSGLAKAIKEYLLMRESAFKSESESLFLTDKGRPVYRQWVYRLVNKSITAISNVKKRSPHVLRHTYATHLLNRGADLNAIKTLLGHSSLAATQKYTHVSVEQLKRVHKKTHPRG